MEGPSDQSNALCRMIFNFLHGYMINFEPRKGISKLANSGAALVDVKVYSICVANKCFTEKDFSNSNPFTASSQPCRVFQI